MILTIWVAKAAQIAIRLLGRAGTHTPGLIARRLHPGIIGALRHPARVIAVTGTNGKTTVSNLLTDALEAQGLTVASNRTGSNIPAGVATMLNAQALSGDFDQLLVIAAPKTLGELRKHWGKPLQAKLVGEMAKDLTGMTTDQIVKAIDNA